MHAMAREYGTDPWTVYHWSIGRFDFNLTCFLAYAEEQEAAQGKREFSSSPPEWR